MLQASPLKSSSSPSVESETVAADSNRSPNASSPEKSTAFAGWSVAWANAIARPPTASAAAAVSTNSRVSTTRLVQCATSTNANVTAAAATPSTIVQPKSPQPGPPNADSGNGLSVHALVLSPDHEPNPMNTSEPTPAASRPGSRITGSVAPPSPAASMMITAPITGEPKIAETAAKLPAAPITATP